MAFYFVLLLKTASSTKQDSNWYGCVGPQSLVNSQVGLDLS